jgi:Fe-S cluster assembly scaffold protein SufB
VIVGMPIVVEKVWPAGGDAMLSRTIVVAERGSTVTIVEDLTSEGTTPRIAIPHVDVYAGPGAKVRYAAIRRFSPGVVDLGFQRFRSASDSDLAVHNVFAGEGKSKVGIQSDMEGNGARVNLYGLVAAGDHQRIDVNSFQQVDGRSSQSDLLYLSALYDHAKAIFYGKIRVEGFRQLSGVPEHAPLGPRRRGSDPGARDPHERRRPLRTRRHGRRTRR